MTESALDGGGRRLTAVARFTAVERFNREIRAQLIRHGLEQRELAEYLELAPSGVAARLAGQRQWRLDELFLLPGFLGVPLRELLPADGDAVAL